MTDKSSIADRLGVSSSEVMEMVDSFGHRITRATADLKKTIPALGPESWTDMDIEIVRLRIAIVRELKAQIAADTKLLFRLEVRRALTPMRSALSRLWQFARMTVDGFRLWVSR